MRKIIFKKGGALALIAPPLDPPLTAIASNFQVAEYSHGSENIVTINTYIWEENITVYDG